MDQILKKYLNKFEILKNCNNVLARQLYEYFIGRQCKIMHPNWNGQRCGRSWPKQYGKIHKITDAVVWNNEIYLYVSIRGESCPINLKHVDLVWLQ